MEGPLHGRNRRQVGHPNHGQRQPQSPEYEPTGPGDQQEMQQRPGPDRRVFDGDGPRFSRRRAAQPSRRQQHPGNRLAPMDRPARGRIVEFGMPDAPDVALGHLLRVGCPVVGVVIQKYPAGRPLAPRPRIGGRSKTRFVGGDRSLPAPGGPGHASSQNQDEHPEEPRAPIHVGETIAVAPPGAQSRSPVPSGEGRICDSVHPTAFLAETDSHTLKRGLHTRPVRSSTFRLDPCTESQMRPPASADGHKKRAAFRPLFVSSLGKDYLRILRRRTIASAPRPSRPIVAGSGTACVVPLTTRLLAPEKPNDVAAPVGEAK